MHPLGRPSENGVIITPSNAPSHTPARGVSQRHALTEHTKRPETSHHAGRRRPSRNPQAFARPGGSYSLPVPDDAYKAVRSPTSRTAWANAVLSVVMTPAGEAHRRRISISLRTFMKCVEAEASMASARDGRGITTSHDTLARMIGMSKITARRARALLEALDCLITVQTGRYLLHLERLEATAHHGGKQLRAASVRALNMPKNLEAVPNEHLATASRFNPTTYLFKSSPRRGKPHSEPAPRAQQRQKRAKFVPGADQPRSLPLQRLAARLVSSIPWLPNDLSTLRVQRIVHRSGFDANRFSYGDLIAIWQAIDESMGQTPKNAGDVNDPEAYLVVRMKLAALHARWYGPRS